MNYEELEGKIVNCRHRHKKALVVGIDPDIGITLVDAKNHDSYLLCVDMTKAVDHNLANTARELFDLVAEQLDKGYYDAEAVRSSTVSKLNPWSFGTNPTQESCPFNK